MDCKEMARLTYEALQKRKEEREKQRIKAEVLADRYRYGTIKNAKDNQARQKKKGY